MHCTLWLRAYADKAWSVLMQARQLTGSVTSGKTKGRIKRCMIAWGHAETRTSTSRCCTCRSTGSRWLVLALLVTLKFLKISGLRSSVPQPNICTAAPGPKALVVQLFSLPLCVGLAVNPLHASCGAHAGQGQGRSSWGAGGERGGSQGRGQPQQTR